jgi:hypothetical protein
MDIQTESGRDEQKKSHANGIQRAVETPACFSVYRQKSHAVKPRLSSKAKRGGISDLVVSETYRRFYSCKAVSEVYATAH